MLMLEGLKCWIYYTEQIPVLGRISYMRWCFSCETIDSCTRKLCKCNVKPFTNHCDYKKKPWHRWCQCHLATNKKTKDVGFSKGGRSRGRYDHDRKWCIWSHPSCDKGGVHFILKAVKHSPGHQSFGLTCISL